MIRRTTSIVLGLYTDAGNPNRTYTLYGDRLLFDGNVGAVQHRGLRSGVVADLRQRLSKLGSRYRSP